MVISDIKNCCNCNLYKNQPPLLMQNVNTCDIMWIGLSAKIIKSKEEEPLSLCTNSGVLIHKIINKTADLRHYKTNLVKCVPLKENKLRYPNKGEIEACINHIDIEIKELQPKIIFLLGGKVIEAIEKHYNIKINKWTDFSYKETIYKNTIFVGIHHPSYISVYKKKNISNYIENIKFLIKKNIKRK